MTNFKPFNDKLVYSTHICEYHPIEKELLYNEDCKSSFDDFHRKKSMLYMMVKMARIKFIPDSFTISSDFVINGIVIVGERREKVAFNVAKYLFARSGVTDKFKSWEEWAAKVMSRWKFEASTPLTPAQAYRQYSGIDLKLSTEELLYIDCKLVQSIKQGNMESGNIMSPIQLAHVFDWEVLSPLEVIYVGKSKNGVLKRTRTHDKWGAITTDLSSDEVVVVYFMDIESKSVAKREFGSLITYEEFKEKAIDRESEALITEAAFIKYFFDEKGYNEKIVDQDFESVGKVKEKLIARGYTSVVAELCLEGVFGKLGTQKVGYHSKHSFIHSLTEV